MTLSTEGSIARASVGPSFADCVVQEAVLRVCGPHRHEPSRRP